MKDKVRIVFDREALPYESACRKLASGACPVFFPVDFLEEENRIQAFFHVKGYHRLRDEKNMTASEILTLIKSVLKNMQICRDWFWFPENYVLSADTVYIRNVHDVRFVYIPDRQHISASRRLNGFLQSLKKHTGERGIMYLETCMRFFDGEYLATRQLLAFLDQRLMEEYEYEKQSYPGFSCI